MNPPDLDRERSERTHTLENFMKLYNENLPVSFPRATLPLLTEYKLSHAEFFKTTDTWSLNIHRKKIMDWLSVRPV
jgi:hypothetical protein